MGWSIYERATSWVVDWNGCPRILCIDIFEWFSAHRTLVQDGRKQKFGHSEGEYSQTGIYWIWWRNDQHGGELLMLSAYMERTIVGYLSSCSRQNQISMKEQPHCIVILPEKQSYMYSCVHAPAGWGRDISWLVPRIGYRWRVIFTPISHLDNGCIKHSPLFVGSSR